MMLAHISNFNIFLMVILLVKFKIQNSKFKIEKAPRLQNY